METWIDSSQDSVVLNDTAAVNEFGRLARIIAKSHDQAGHLCTDVTTSSAGSVPVSVESRESRRCGGAAHAALPPRSFAGSDYVIASEWDLPLDDRAAQALHRIDHRAFIP